MAVIGLMAALTAFGAFVRIPFPYVPITLQLTVVCVAGAWLGAARGATSQAVYVATGLIGFPVFAKGGGPQYVLEPSFGYLLGFIPGAFVIGLLSRGGFRRLLLAMWVGVGIVYVIGVAYLWIVMRFLLDTRLSTGAILQLGVAPLPKDLLLGIPAAYAAFRLRRLRPPP